MECSGTKILREHAWLSFAEAQNGWLLWFGWLTGNWCPGSVFLVLMRIRLLCLFYLRFHEAWEELVAFVVYTYYPVPYCTGVIPTLHNMNKWFCSDWWQCWKTHFWSISSSIFSFFASRNPYCHGTARAGGCRLLPSATHATAAAPTGTCHNFSPFCNESRSQTIYLQHMIYAYNTCLLLVHQTNLNIKIDVVATNIWLHI